MNGARHQPYASVIVPTYNGAGKIGRCLEALRRQDCKSVFEVIVVSDGSTDGTDDIVRGHVAEHPWIEFVRTPERRERHFAGKVHAFNASYAHVKGVGYEVIGNLDADGVFRV